MRCDTLFLTLNIFSATGGIEKVCRVAGKALYERSVEKQQRLMVWSMHDKQQAANDNPYFPTEIYKSYQGKKAHFVKDAVRQGRKSKTVILSHINLIMIGWSIKKISPGTRIILMAHGIEIWNSISASKATFINSVDSIWAVSHYTRSRVMQNHGWPAGSIHVLNNCLDPFLPHSKNIAVPASLKDRYGIEPHHKVLFTLTRLSSKEKYKGYDDVLAALAALKDPGIKYILAGKADAVELQRMQQKINAAGLQHEVILAGFIADEELAAHFKMSDCYIMPSSKEGFGIVFIEAMYYGLPVIGGNADGTMDALKNGALGTAVSPGDIPQIKDAIKKIMIDPDKHKPDHEKLMNYFGYPVYKERLGELLDEC